MPMVTSADALIQVYPWMTAVQLTVKSCTTLITTPIVNIAFSSALAGGRTKKREPQPPLRLHNHIRARQMLPTPGIGIPHRAASLPCDEPGWPALPG
jgi:hypothetical protein